MCTNPRRQASPRTQAVRFASRCVGGHPTRCKFAGFVVESIYKLRKGTMNHTYDHQCSCPICVDNERRIREIMKEEKALDLKCSASLRTFFQEVRVMVKK